MVVRIRKAVGTVSRSVFRRVSRRGFRREGSEGGSSDVTTPY